MEDLYFAFGLLASIVVLVITVVGWFKLPNGKQLENIKEWLLYATIEAEKELGSGTGQLKLRYVYDQFIKTFGWSARFISFEMFSGLVSEALEEMKQLLDNNKEVRKIVEGQNKEVK